MHDGSLLVLISDAFTIVAIALSRVRILPVGWVIIPPGTSLDGAEANLFTTAVVFLGTISEFRWG